MSLIELNSKQHLINTVSILHEQQKHTLVALYFYMESNELCRLISNRMRDANKKYNDNDNILFLFINVEKQSNQEILSMFNVSIVPYCVIMRDGYILQKLFDSSLKDFLFTLDECAPIIYSVGGNDHHNEHDQLTKKCSLVMENTYLYDDDMDTETLDNDMDEKIEKLVSVAPVMLFIKGTPTEPKCRFSKNLIELLRKNQVRFGFFNVLRDPIIKNELKRFADWPTFPQLYINGEFQGGLDIVKENIQEDPMFFQKRI
ncbi:monothiol glutaredoxin-4 [Monosporozyma servazzii]